MITFCKVGNAVLKNGDCAWCGQHYIGGIRSRYCSSLCCRNAERKMAWIACRGWKPCRTCERSFFDVKTAQHCSSSCYWKRVNKSRRAKLRDYMKTYQRPLQTRLRSRIANTIYQKLRRNNIRKAGKRTFAHLPYSVGELQKHCEQYFTPDNGFTWDNWGRVWHLDHVVPQSHFQYSTFDCPEFIACWALSNLKPVTKEYNLSKGAKLLPAYAT